MNITKLVSWFWKTYEAKTIVQGKDESREWRNGAFDAIVQVLMDQNPTWTKDEAETWLVEEINEMACSND